jgi:orotate phosphoribosyltransferase
MTEEEVIEIFKEAGALLEGHFILSSGLHSPVFLQKARVFMYPDRTERLCKALAAKVLAEELESIDFIAAPAVGALIPGYETARHLGVPAVWVEREDGVMRLRRFELPPGSRVLVVEDVITTGLSVRETILGLQAARLAVVGCACLIDRSGGEADLGVPLVALAQYKVPAYRADALPPELAAIPPVKPGSRGLA